jgi:CBS domain-containing protein
VLRHECARAALAVPSWSVLDTRLLAELAAPTLAGFSLENLAAWLQIDTAGRHRALPDAVLAGQVFLALLPHLKERGIRTVVEAQAACAGLTRALDQYHRAGWTDPGRDLEDADRLGVERRLDSYPYRHQVRELMSRPPAFAKADKSLRDALVAMIDARISSLFIGEADAAAAAIGIVTERDILRAIRASGAAALEVPVAAIATRSLVCVSEDAFIYRAIVRMRRFGIRHLAVVADDERISGALSARDLLRLRADTAIVLGDDIDPAPDIPALARAWAKVPTMAASLVARR